MGDCITPLQATQADDDLPQQTDWQKRLETVPKRLLEFPNGDKFAFDTDTRRWRRRIQHYKEVNFLLEISTTSYPALKS